MMMNSGGVVSSLTEDPFLNGYYARDSFSRTPSRLEAHRAPNPLQSIQDLRLESYLRKINYKTLLNNLKFPSILLLTRTIRPMDPHSSDFTEPDFEPRQSPEPGNGLRRLALLLPLVAASVTSTLAASAVHQCPSPDTIPREADVLDVDPPVFVSLDDASVDLQPLIGPVVDSGPFALTRRLPISV